jgi:gliding motility-associated-like protein
MIGFGQQCDTIYPSQYADTIIYCITNSSCHSSCDGEITVTVIGPNQPYYFEWGSGGPIVNDNFRDSLCAGNYSVTITDNFGNFVNYQSNQIEEPSELGIFRTLNNPSCFDYSDGSINITTLGDAPFTWNWDNGFSTEDLSNLSSGEYILTTTDSNSCFRIDTFNLVDPVQVSSSTISDTLSCIGLCDANGIVIPQDGIPPYTYLWDNGQVNDTAINLCYGINNVIITDINGCLDTNEVFISNPDTIKISNITTDSSCYGQCDGQISVTITGGNSPYSTSWIYNGIEFNNTDTITNNDLCPGNYFLAYSDDNNCIDTAEILLIERDSFQLQDWIINDSCYNSCTGQIQVQLLNKTNPPFIYDWSNGQTDTILSNLCSDTIALTLIDSRLCSQSYEFFIEDGDSIYFDSLYVLDNSCYGDSLGVISLINVSGGVAPIIYNWSDGQVTTAPGIHSLPSGNYSVNIVDAFGCTLDLANIFIDHPDSLFITSSSLINTSCYGSSDGVIDIDIFGGVSPYFISWDHLIPDSSFIDSVPAGDYIYTILDSNLCFISDTLTIEEPDMLVLSDSIVDILCKSQNTGEIHLTISGGTPPFQLSIDSAITFQSQNYFVNLFAGSYTVIVKDANDCLFYSPLYNIIEPLSSLNASLNGPNLLCYGDTGSIILTVNGGTPNYSFFWNNGASSQNLNGIGSGAFSVTIVDDNNCDFIRTISVTEPDALVLLHDLNNLLCYQDNSGSINTTLNGGVTPYEYQWNNGDTLSYINNLSSGTYNLVVHDNNNCILNQSFIVEEPDLLEINFQHTHVDCYGNSTGEIDITVVGGTPDYTYDWSNLSNDEDLVNIPFGSYDLTIVDSNFCKASTTITINQPSEIVYNIQILDLLCNNISDGEITINVSGGTPAYIYSIDGGNNYQTNNVFVGLSSGTYSIWIKDDNSCFKNQTEFIDQPLSFSNIGSSQIDIEKCFGDATGSIDLIVSGQNPPYSYSWSNGASSSSLNNLMSDSYDVVVSDLNNCEISYTFLITEPQELELEFDIQSASCQERDDGSITTFVKGGTGQIYYEWSNGQNSSDIFDLPIGTYSLNIYDTEGCSLPIEYFDVGFDNFNACLEIPSGFTPNNDNIHDEWIIYGLDDFNDIQIKVFNRWGQEVFYSNGTEKVWDGKFNGEDLPIATYYYVIEINQSEKVFNGTVTIKR